MSSGCPIVLSQYTPGWVLNELVESYNNTWDLAKYHRQVYTVFAKVINSAHPANNYLIQPLVAELEEFYQTYILKTGMYPAVTAQMDDEVPEGVNELSWRRTAGRNRSRLDDENWIPQLLGFPIWISNALNMLRLNQSLIQMIGLDTDQPADPSVSHRLLANCSREVYLFRSLNEQRMRQQMPSMVSNCKIRVPTTVPQRRQYAGLSDNIHNQILGGSFISRNRRYQTVAALSSHNVMSGSLHPGLSASVQDNWIPWRHSPLPGAVPTGEYPHVCAIGGEEVAFREIAGAPFVAYIHDNPVNRRWLRMISGMLRREQDIHVHSRKLHITDSFPASVNRRGESISLRARLLDANKGRNFSAMVNDALRPIDAHVVQQDPLQQRSAYTNLKDLIPESLEEGAQCLELIQVFLFLPRKCEGKGHIIDTRVLNEERTPVDELPEIRTQQVNAGFRGDLTDSSSHFPCVGTIPRDSISLNALNSDGNGEETNIYNISENMLWQVISQNPTASKSLMETLQSIQAVREISLLCS